MKYYRKWIITKNIKKWKKSERFEIIVKTTRRTEKEFKKNRREPNEREERKRSGTTIKSNYKYKYIYYRHYNWWQPVILWVPKTMTNCLCRNSFNRWINNCWK